MRGTLFELVYRHPDLLLDHGQLYLNLVRDELNRARSFWIRRTALIVASGVIGLLAFIWLGMSVTLGLSGLAVWSWQLFAIPGVSLLIAAVLLLLARSSAPSAMKTIMEQFGKDWALLRESVSHNQPAV